MQAQKGFWEIPIEQQQSEKGKKSSYYLFSCNSSLIKANGICLYFLNCLTIVDKIINFRKNSKNGQEEKIEKNQSCIDNNSASVCICLANHRRLEREDERTCLRICLHFHYLTPLTHFFSLILLLLLLQISVCFSIFH